MKHVVLIQCAKGKQRHKAPARDLYTSPLFRGSLRYAESLNPDAIYILSAKHGLLDTDTVVSPYDETLRAMPTDKRRTWTERVLAELTEVSDLKKDMFTLLAGVRYREFLIDALPNHSVPMKGLGIGKQLQFLKIHAK